MRGQRVDQERDQDRLEPVLVGDQRRHHEGREPPAAGRPTRSWTMGKIAWSLAYVRLELAGLAVDHGLDPLDDLLAEEALGAEQQECERQT